MFWYDWLIIVIPLLFVLGMGVYTRRYLRDVTTFLSAGRVCGRYVISVGNIANAISIIGLLAYVEIHYKTGFALSFWSRITMPIGVFLSLFGYCMYRFRETKAQSIGQFFELRYSRNFRIFAAFLRSCSEMLANMIMPALAARFFMYVMDLPKQFCLWGLTFDTYSAIMILVLTIAISIICMGGSIAIIVTDTIQGFFCYPLMAIFVCFVLYKFSWTNEILPVLSHRAAGENFLNPYEIYHLRDFNYFSLIVAVLAMFLHRASWTGAGGSSSAAKTPHEQKMASLLGTWRDAITSLFYVLIAIALLTFLNHQDFASQAHSIRQTLSTRIAGDVVKNSSMKTQVLRKIQEAPAEHYNPVTGKPLSDKDNLDTRFLSGIRTELTSKDAAKGNALFQQFRTLYYQQMLPVALRSMLPRGLMGLFCLLMVLAMVSTDDSRIFSATITISQDVILPFIKKTLTPKQHMWLLRWVSIAIGVIFFLGSRYMAQLDYIRLYTTLVCSMWLGGCGPVIVFGLYSRIGTTLGAWASLLCGMFMSIVGVIVQRNWADGIYPWLQNQGLEGTVGTILETLSRPFNPIVVWKMNAVKCPINSYEWYFITMILSLILYFAFSYFSRQEPFNLDRMLHRGKYALGEERVIKTPWTWKNVYAKLVGITPEYSFWDKVIAWSYFFYSIIYGFFGSFIIVIIWNLFDPWTPTMWGWYFLIVFLIVPGILAAFSAFWFGICGVIDLRRMFHDLEIRIINPLDDGRVEGNMSLADKKELEAVDKNGASGTEKDGQSAK